MRNTYRVPKRQWRKWNANARNVFNTLYQTMRDGQEIYNARPKAPQLPRDAWNTVAWNAAWIAASSVAA